tara:strand:- start:703 stop:1233 length:531 start_codon:yes stop_codon:yes gene_type:complete
MSKKETSTFYLTERITMTSDGTPVTATVDLGSFIDVVQRQCLAIEEVDFIFQGTTADTRMIVATGSDADIFVQLSDLNRGGTIQFADDRALVASATLTVDSSNNATFKSSDHFPDVFGSKDGVRLVVNDQLYITGEASAVASSNAVNCTVRIKCHVRKLSQKDFVALTLQSVAADN